MVRMVENMHKFQIITEPPSGELLARWNDLLKDAPFASHYVTTDFFVDPFAGKGERFAVLAMLDERVDAVVTGIISGKRIISGMAVRPQTAFRHGIDRDPAAKALVDGMRAFAGPNVGLFTFHSWEPIDGLEDEGYSHREAEDAGRVVMLDLSKGPEALFKEFSERRRTDLRKTMKLGLVQVKRLETEAELAELYEIHKDWNTRKGFAADAFEAFQGILHSKHRAVFIALTEGKVIAGTFLRFCEGGVIEYAANNSLGDYQKLRPNEILGWRAIEWACSAGFTKFSLGASHTFLSRFGGELVSSHRYQFDRTFLKRHQTRERAERMVVKAYQSLPENMRKRIKAVTA